MTGLIRPASISGHTCAFSCTATLPLNVTERGRNVEPVITRRRRSTSLRLISAFEPPRVAMTTTRPYRKALPTATAYQMMRRDARGGWCREELLEAFLELHRGQQLARARIAV